MRFSFFRNRKSNDINANGSSFNVSLLIDLAVDAFINRGQDSLKLSDNYYQDAYKVKQDKTRFYEH